MTRDAGMKMGWIFLCLAIVFEVIGTTFLKRAQGHLLSPSGGWMLAFYAVSFSCLTLAIKYNIELGVGYAIWSGVGTALIALIGVLAFGEHASTLKFVCIGVIILGVVGLKMDQPRPIDPELKADQSAVDEQDGRPDVVRFEARVQQDSLTRRSGRHVVAQKK